MLVNIQLHILIDKLMNMLAKTCTMIVLLIYPISFENSYIVITATVFSVTKAWTIMFTI